MKYLWLLLLAVTAFGQNIRYDSVAFGPKGPIPNATIAVCSQPATTSTQPCTPVAKLCSSITDTACTQPNPFFADALGNFHFYVSLSSTPVTIQIYGPSVAVPLILPDQLVSSVSPSAPMISVTPNTLTFGTVQTTTTSTQNITILNVGNVSVTINSVALTGSTDFSSTGLTACQIAIPSGGSCVVPITFAPTSATAESATLTVTPSGAGAQAVAITGTGIATSTFPVTLVMSGTGSGQVTSGEAPPNISCSWSNFVQSPPQCTFNYPSGTSVTLTPNPVSPSTFSGFGGDGTCTGTAACTFTVSAAANITAGFNLPASSSSLTITGTGQGSGNVVSDASTSTGSGQLNCNIAAGVDSSGGGAGCSGAFVTGTTVTLTESPQSGSTFAGWTPGSACSNDTTGASTTCAVVLNASATVTANFGTTGIPLSLKQTATCNANTGNAIKCVWSQAQTAGDFIVCGFNWSDATTTVSSVADTSVNTYSVGRALAALTDISQVVYYAPNILAAAAGANTTTVTLSANPNNRNGRCIEYAGVVTATPVDQTAGATGTSATPASGAILATTQGNDLITGFVAGDASVQTASTGFTQQILQNSGGGGNTFSTVQYVRVSANCSSGSATCALPALTNATGTGNIIAVHVVFGDTTTTVSSVTDDATGGSNTYTICCYQSNGTAFKSTTWAYVASSKSGAKNITVTASAAPAAAWRLEGEVASYSGTSAAFDTSGTATNNACGTTCAGVALTLTGTNDIIFQGIAAGSNISAISAPYTLNTPTGLANAMATALNVSSGAAPNWTLSAAAGVAEDAIAFKGTASGIGADAEDIQGVASGSTPNFQPKLSASANWVAQEIAWKAQQTSPPTTSPTLTIVAGSSTGSGNVFTVQGTPLLNCTISPPGVTSGVCSMTMPSTSTFSINMNPASGASFTISGVNGCSNNVTPCIDTVGTANQTVTVAFNSTSTTFSLTNQEPTNNTPYPNSLFATTKTLPNAGAGGPSGAQISTNSANIVNQLVTWGGSGFGNTPMTSPAAGAGMPAKYYGQSSDPVYVLNSCSAVPSSSAPNYPLNKPFHAPSGASTEVSSTANDRFMTIWDQTNNNVFTFYLFTTSWAFPACPGTTGHAGTTADPCPVSSPMKCEMDNYAHSNMPTPAIGAAGFWASAGFSPLVGMTREQDLVSGQGIPHAIYLDTPCTNGTTVFPNIVGNATSICSPSNPNAPPNGSLVFLDYTNAQLADIKSKVPGWQYAWIYALTYYGGYIGDTFGGTVIGLSASRVEGSKAYSFLNVTSPNGSGLSGPNAFWSWFSAQPGTNCFALNGGTKCNPIIFNGIPLEGGTGIASHMHIADQCVAKTLAGVSGGC